MVKNGEGSYERRFTKSLFTQDIYPRLWKLMIAMQKLQKTSCRQAGCPQILSTLQGFQFQGNSKHFGHPWLRYHRLKSQKFRKRRTFSLELSIYPPPSSEKLVKFSDIDCKLQLDRRIDLLKAFLATFLKVKLWLRGLSPPVFNFEFVLSKGPN